METHLLLLILELQHQHISDRFIQEQFPVVSQPSQQELPRLPQAPPQLPIQQTGFVLPPILL